MELSFHDINLQKGVCLIFVHKTSAILYFTLSLTFSDVLFIENIVIGMSKARKAQLIGIVDTIHECVAFLKSNNDC